MDEKEKINILNDSFSKLEPESVTDIIFEFYELLKSMSTEESIILLYTGKPDKDTKDLDQRASFGCVQGQLSTLSKNIIACMEEDSKLCASLSSGVLGWFLFGENSKAKIKWAQHFKDALKDDEDKNIISELRVSHKTIDDNTSACALSSKGDIKDIIDSFKTLSKNDEDFKNLILEIAEKIK